VLFYHYYAKHTEDMTHIRVEHRENEDEVSESKGMVFNSNVWIICKHVSVTLSSHKYKQEKEETKKSMNK